MNGWPWFLTGVAGLLLAGWLVRVLARDRRKPRIPLDRLADPRPDPGIDRHPEPRTNPEEDKSE